MVEQSHDEDSQQITGVRISVQASQDIVPQIHEVRFLTKGHYFRLSSSTDVSPDAWDLVSVSYQQAVKTNQLPAAQGTHSLPKWDPPTHKIPIRTDYVSQGDSPIECEMNVDIQNGGVPSTARMYHSKGGGDNQVVQVVTSGKVMLRNPTDDKLYVQSVSTDFSTAGGSQQLTSGAGNQAPTTRIGVFHGTSMDWGIPHPDVAWTTKTSWELPPKSVHELCIESSIVLPADAAPAYGSKPFSMRLHPHFDEPITVRATFVDNEKRTQSIRWDYSNPLLEPRDVNSYADALANEKYCQNGIGEQFECLVFLHWDNPKTLMRTYLVVTRDRTAPTVYLRIADTTGAFPSSYTKFTKDDITRMIYDAEEGTTRIDQTHRCCTSTSHCNVWLLMDPRLKVVYGIEAQIVEDAACGLPVILLSQAAYLDPMPSVTDKAT